MSKDEFFKRMESIGLALTFDDVRLKTGRQISQTLPKDVSISSKFSRNVPLKMPIVSAPMDTVTEHKMAIAMAKAGGLGIIHRNLTIREQASEVAKVKYHLHGLIRKPICISEDEIIENILKKRQEKGYNFHTFPVINKEKQLIGILTENDFDFCHDHSLKAKEVMTKDPISGNKKTTIDQAYDIMKKDKKKVLPLINENKELVGMYILSDIKRIKSGESNMYNIDNNGQLIVGAAIGIGEEAIERVKKLIEMKVDVVVIDTSHADSINVYNTLKELKKTFPQLDVVVGNISEPESAKRLAEAGADGIKVGQGPGSICTTRIIAGIGAPQLSAVYKCSQAVKDIPICADGGLRYSGDIPIAIGAGAHCVMMGGMLSGTKETPGEIVYLEGRSWKKYRGMGSLSAMQESKASRERYGQERSEKGQLIPEGIEGLKPYKGDVNQVLFQYSGGLRNGMGSIGAKNIEELRELADFIRITASGKTESHPHDVRITEDAPNYERR